MSGIGSSVQLQGMANDVRSSLGAPADQSGTSDDTSSGDRQSLHRRLLASSTDDSNDNTDGGTTGNSEEDNSLTKFAKALGNIYKHHFIGFPLFSCPIIIIAINE
jgi:hypothetical protein